MTTTTEEVRAKDRARCAAWRLANPDKNKASQDKYRAANPEKVRARVSAYRAANRKKVNANAAIRQAAYYARNRDACCVAQSAYQRRRRAQDPLFRLIQNLRRRVGLAFKCCGKTKSQASFSLLGCSKEELRQHLVSQFREGMTLENHGKVWHIDHIRPCASFDLSDPNQVVLCFHYSNLQPLFADENMRKGDKWEPTELRPLAA